MRSVFESMTKGGIAIPNVANDRRKVGKAEVLAVGDTVIGGYAGGDVVFFMVGEAVAVDHQGETFLLVKTENVLAVEGEEQEPIMLDLPDVGEEGPRLDDEAFQ